MIATNVEELGVLDQLPDLGLLQVLNLVLVGGGKVGAQGAVVAGDDNTAATSGGLLIITVGSLDTGMGTDVLKLLAVLVAANAANVDGGIGGEDVLYQL